MTTHMRAPLIRTDRADVFFNFSAPFEIYDDNAVLQKLRLQETSPQQLAEIFPEQLREIACRIAS